MPNLMIDRLQSRHEELRAATKDILDNAAGEDRDVTDVERESVEEQYREMSKIEEQLKPLEAAELRQIERDKARGELARASKSRSDTERQQVAQGGQLQQYRSGGGGDYYPVGRYLVDWARKGEDPAAAQRVMRARAEFRVVADQLLADNPGIVPTPIVGPVGGTLPTARPYIDSVTNRPMPSAGSSFNRPKITQHTDVAVQATEKTQLASRKMLISDVNVAKQTFGGTLDISFQNRDWTDPAILAIAVADLEAVYAQVTDNAGADYFATATTNTFTLADGAQDGVVRSAFYSAASQIFADTKMRPDTVWMSPDEYAWYAAMTPSGGSGPAFPGLGDLLGNGASMLGMRVVVDGNFAPKTTIIGVASQVEHYEQVGGRLAVTEPTILGYTIAYYGYVADLLVEAKAARKRSAT